MTWISDWTFAWYILVVILGLYVLQRRRLRKIERTYPLPPGPKPRFLVGNLADLPKRDDKDWEHWLKHKDLYGS
jgi:hypothetical protein